MRLVRNQGLKKPIAPAPGLWRCSGIRCASIWRKAFRWSRQEAAYALDHLRALWFLRGETNTKYLKDNGVSIWDEWADETASSAPCMDVNGAPGRRPTAVTSIKSAAASISSAAIPIHGASSSMLERGRARANALTPCMHCFSSGSRCKLSCQLYQRSADTFLGVPFNIASYALLTHMFAQQCDLGVGDFIWTGGDCHLYLNHLQQADLQLSREPRALPQLAIKRRPASIFEYRFEDFEIQGYDPHPHIKATVAV